MSSGVNPVVILGNRTSGVGADDVRSGFNKFNNHDHWLVMPGDWRYYNLAIGDEVRVLNCAGEDVTQQVAAATIEYITGSTLRLSNPAGETLNNCVLYTGIDFSVEIKGVNTVIGSSLITFYEQPDRDFGNGLQGFISPEQAIALGTWTVTGALNNPQTGRYSLVGNLPVKAWLVEARLQSEGLSGNYCEAQLGAYLNGHYTQYGSLTTISTLSQTIELIENEAANIGNATYSATSPQRPLNIGDSVIIDLSNFNSQLIYGYGIGAWTSDLDTQLLYSLKFTVALT